MSFFPEKYVLIVKETDRHWPTAADNNRLTPWWPAQII